MSRELRVLRVGSPCGCGAAARSAVASVGSARLARRSTPRRRLGSCATAPGGAFLSRTFASPTPRRRSPSLPFASPALATASLRLRATPTGLASISPTWGATLLHCQPRGVSIMSVTGYIDWGMEKNLPVEARFFSPPIPDCGAEKNHWGAHEALGGRKKPLGGGKIVLTLHLLDLGPGCALQQVSYIFRGS